MKRYMHSTALLIVLVLMTGLLAGAAAENKGYIIEENPGKNQNSYPYRIISDSAVLYLGRADIELLGEEAFYAGLDLIMASMETDFTQARETLKDYLKEGLLPVSIYTDFAGKAEESQIFPAYYYDAQRGIRLFKGWTAAGANLLHEYVHYLTDACVTFSVTTGFWAEGIAEYISRLACENSMAKAVHYGIPDAAAAFMIAHGAGDAEGKPDYRKMYYGTAAAYGLPVNVGFEYFAVCNSRMKLTDRQLEHPMMTSVAYEEAACFIEYLITRFGQDFVFTHMNCDHAAFADVYGIRFEDLFNEWKQENLKKCAELGLQLYE